MAIQTAPGIGESKKPLIEHHGDRFRNPDLYQAFTYAAALGAPAVLVYPKVDEDIKVALEVGGHEARAMSIDLTLVASEHSTLIHQLRVFNEVL